MLSVITISIVPTVYAQDTINNPLDKLVQHNELPVITSFTINDKVDSIFTNEPIHIQMTVSDNSGVNKAIIVLDDTTSKQKMYYTNQSWIDLNDISLAFQTGNIDIQNNILDIVLPLPPNFKGQVYAYVQDKLGNISQVDIDKVIDVVYEDKDSHLQNSSLVIQMDNPNAYIEKIPLYNKQPTFNITAIENVVGIQRVEWEFVQSGNVLEQKSIDFNDLANDTTTQDIQVKTKGDAIYELNVPNVSFNVENSPVTVHIKTTNKSGNINEYEYQYIVDTTAPKVMYTQDLSMRYFNESLVIDVDIVDKYVDNQHIEVIGNIHNIHWEQTDKGLHGKIILARDGEYNWRIISRDLVGNVSEIIDQSVVIDMVAPKINIQTDTRKKDNFFNELSYYQAVVTEDNLQYVKMDVFKDNRLSQTITDKRVMTLNDFTDGQYIVNITAMDLAGNSQSVIDTFTVDTKIDKLAILGVIDGQFYKKVPSMLFYGQDEHIAKKQIAIYYVNHTGEQLLFEQNFDNNDVFEYDLQRVVTQDGYYRIIASVEDMAGNRQKEANTIIISQEGIKKYVETFLYNQIYHDNPFHNNESVVVSLLSWLPFHTTKLVLLKDSKLVPVSYHIEHSHNEYQPYKQRLIIDTSTFDTNGEYELFVFANNIVKDNVLNANIMSITIDNQGPEVNVIYVPHKNSLNVDVRDQLGIDTISFYINGVLFKQDKAYKESSYITQVPINKNDLPITIKWVATDSIGNKTEGYYNIDTVSEFKNDDIPIVKSIVPQKNTYTLKQNKSDNNVLLILSIIVIIGLIIFIIVKIMTFRNI